MSMTYPTMKVTLPEWVNRNVSAGTPGSTLDAAVFNLVFRLLEALEDRLGLAADPEAMGAGTGSIEGRVKRLEASGLPSIYIGTTEPITPIVNDLWLDLNTPIQWKVRTPPTWSPVGSNAVTIQGKTVSDAAPSHLYTLSWDEVSESFIYMPPAIANPMIAAGDLIVGGTDGAITRIAVGLVNQLFQSDGTNAAWTYPTTLELAGNTAPTISAAGRTKIVYNSTAGKLQSSINGAAYTDIGAGGGGSSSDADLHPFLLLGA